MKRLITLASAVLLVLLVVAGPASAQSDGFTPGPGDDTSVLPRTIIRDTDVDSNNPLPNPPPNVNPPGAVSATAASPTTGVAGVQIDRGPLAQTGIQVTTGALLAAILLAGGGLALVTARRRSVQL